jgi:tetraacyldisaccharide 4'-kinase
VTKCPENISVDEQEKIKSELKIESHQQLYFSSISYSDEIVSKEKKIGLEELKNKPFTLVTGIANPKPLVDYLNKKGFKFNHEAYKDHHDFSASEISKLEKMELVLTTEKDYVRLKDTLKSNNVYYLPIASNILNAEAFNNNIKKFIKSF